MEEAPRRSETKPLCLNDTRVDLLDLGINQSNKILKLRNKCLRILLGTEDHSDPEALSININIVLKTKNQKNLFVILGHVKM